MIVMRSERIGGMNPDGSFLLDLDSVSGKIVGYCQSTDQERIFPCPRICWSNMHLFCYVNGERHALPVQRLPNQRKLLTHILLTQFLQTADEQIKTRPGEARGHHLLRNNLKR